MRLLMFNIVRPNKYFQYLHLVDEKNIYRNMNKLLILFCFVFLQAGAIVTVLMLLIFYTSSIFLFVGTCLCGLFLSSIFPCMLAYTEDILDYQGIMKCFMAQ